MTRHFDLLVKLCGGKEAYLRKVDDGDLEGILYSVDPPAAEELQRASPSMFRDDPKIKELLKEASAISSFEPTKEYLLQILASENPAEQQAPNDKMDPAFYLRGSFRSDYIGRAVDGLFLYLEECDKKFVSGHYYSRHCSITQSSGTGKTRTIIELAKRDVLVVYLNVRPTEDTNSYPPRDDIPADILAGNFPSSPLDYADRCVAFFHALFDALLSKQVGILAKENDPSKVVKAWSKNMCTMESSARSRFFNAVKIRYGEVLANMKSQRAALVEELNGTEMAGADTQGVEGSANNMSINGPDMSGLSGNNPASDTLVHFHNGDSLRDRPGAVNTLPELIGEKAMMGAYKKLVANLPQLFENRPNPHTPKLVIAIDETHELSKTVRGQYRPSHILYRLISAFSKTCPGASTWVVFASTATEVADFSPPHIRPSHRIRQGGELLFPPYILLGWDQKALKPKDLKLQPRNVARFSHIVGYGRPLWSSLMSSSASVDMILDMGREKLCKSPIFDPRRPMQTLAVYAQRFCLDAQFGHPRANSYQEKSVSSYLRVCTGITPDRTWQNTAYLSEPVLACSSAQALHAPGNLVISLQRLKDQVASGLIDMDKRGELVSRLILLIAKDLCVRQLDFWPRTEQASANAWDEELLDCRPLPVVKYLGFMFGDDCLDDSMKKLFGNWYIDFSHWTAMVKNINVSPGRPLSLEDWITQHWYRTTALQCCHDQPYIDKVIPMYYLAPPSESNSMSQTHLEQQPGSSARPTSYILISDGARGRSSRASLKSITPQKSLGAQTGQPYIAILLDLRVGDGKNPGFALADKSKAKDPCLRIYAPGINTTTYSFLDRIPGAVSLLKEMLYPPVGPEKLSSQLELLRDQFEYGSTCEPRRMRWEANAEDGNFV